MFQLNSTNPLVDVNNYLTNFGLLWYKILDLSVEKGMNFKPKKTNFQQKS